MPDLPTGTVTFLFTDIEGSTALAQQFPAEMPALLARHHTVLRQAIEAHHGYVFQIIGDAFCAAFPTASEALQAALDAQRGLQHEAWNPAPVSVRMGIHTGSAQAGAIEERAGGYVGYLTLTRVQRVMSTAHGEQILLSNPTAELVRGELPADVTLSDMGEHRLKGLVNLEHLWQLVAPELRQDFPPLQSLNAIPTNLPVQLTSFIGREKEIAEVKQLLSASRLVTLTGSGGAGKTRLSLHVAAEVIDDFVQGVWFVDLAPLSDAALVPNAVLSTLGLRGQAERAPLDLLTDFLHARKVLLILDNCEHLIQACAQLAHHLLTHCSQIRILATSREVLQVYGEHSYPVLPLALPDLQRKETAAVISQYDAVSLFIQRAKASRPSFEIDDDNAPAVAEICVRLDGLPLAIELAAARLALFSPRQLLQRLADRLKTVSGGLRDLPARQRTLRGTIEWSHDLLSEGEKILFARLSVFQGGRSLEAAEAVCGDELEIEVADGLESLIHKSLLQQVSGSTGEPRYVMLETIHEYARERLAARAEAEAIRRRHAQFFTDWVEQMGMELRAGPTRLARFEQLEVDQGNIAAALEWSLGGADSELGLRLVGAIFYFWWRSGRWVEWRRWMALAPAHLDHVSEATRAATLVAMSAMDLYGIRDSEASRRHSQEALAIYRRLGDRRNIAWTIYSLASPATGAGIAEEYARSLALIEEAITLLRQESDLAGVANGFTNLGEYAFAYGDLVQAKAAYQESLRIAREIGDQLREHIEYQNLGNVALAEGDYDGAAALYRRSLVWARESVVTSFVLNTLACLASLLGLQGQPQRAARLMGASEALLESMGVKLQPNEQRLYDQGVAMVREQLGDETFNALRAEGQAMTLDQAIEYALSQEGET